MRLRLSVHGLRGKKYVLIRYFYAAVFMPQPLHCILFCGEAGFAVRQVLFHNGVELSLKGGEALHRLCR